MPFTKTQGFFVKTTPQDEDHQIANLYSSGIKDNAPTTLLTLTNVITTSANLVVGGDLSLTGGLVIPSGATTTNTTLGVIEFNTTTNAIAIGDGTATRNYSADDGIATLSNKTLTSPVINITVSGSAFLDDDTFATANSTTFSSSESIKAYVDAQVTAQTFNFSTGSGAGTVDLDSQTFGLIASNGLEITHTGQDVTVALDSFVANSASTLDFFSSTSSAQLQGVISDPTGTGALMFSNSPNVNTAITTSTSTFNLLNTTATTLNFGGAATTLTLGATSGNTIIRNADLHINNASGRLMINNAKVVGTRATGWSTLAGTANTAASLNTDSAFGANNELRYLAQHVKAIIDALTTHGLIGS